MIDFWAGKRILVTGGGGFIGSFVVDNLVQKRGVDRANVVVPTSRDCDLTIFDNARRAVDGCQVVLHLAARTGGIAYSRKHPATQYFDCARIDLHVLEAARLAGVEKVVCIGNILAYPASAPSPLHEEQLYDGKIAGTHLGVGLAKRNQVMLAEMYHREFGMDVCVVLSANAYGPRDRFDPQTSHVIPATIVKCCNLEEVVVWGDGTPTRDFLYAEDVAEGLLLAAEKLRGPQFVNIASGQEISIRDLVYLIARLAGFSGRIVFDISKAGGDPKRGATGEKARQLMGFTPRYSLEDGLRRTVEWYRSGGAGGAGGAK